jgi:ElaB/YqjD/DUF883 family membrane-anchored ribosome-binding protein
MSEPTTGCTFSITTYQELIIMQITSNSSAATSKQADVKADVSTLASEFRNFVTDVEDLIKATTSLTGEDLNRAKAKLGQRIAAAKVSVEEVGDQLATRARKTAESTNAYVHERPWTAIGAGAAAGVLLGYLLTRRS